MSIQTEIQGSASLQTVEFRDLGRMRFADAWDLQTTLNRELITWKRGEQSVSQPHYLLFCEHPPVYTLGKSGSESHLRIDEARRAELDVEYFRINRGGDITYHGPGQLVVYPIFDLDRFFTDVHKYVRYLEEAIIRLLATYGLQGTRMQDFTGVWFDGPGGSARKVCAIGVHLSRWVTMHGLALNVNTEMRYFDHIVPCGIQTDDKSVTSISQELGRPVDMDEVKQRLKPIFAELFQFTYVEQSSTQRS